MQPSYKTTHMWKLINEAGHIRSSYRLWIAYGLILSGLAYAYFGHTADHPFDTDDDLYLEDSNAVLHDLSLFFSPSKSFPGRPLTELVLLIGYAAWGEDPGAFHLLSVAIHLLASFALSRAAYQLGSPLTTSLLGGAFFLINVAHLRAVYWISAVSYPIALLCISIGFIFLLCDVTSRSTGKLIGASIEFVMAILAHPAALFCLPVVVYAVRGTLHLKRVRVALVGIIASASIAFIGIYASYPQAPQITQSDFSAGLFGMVQTLLLLLARLVSSAHWIPVPLYSVSQWEYYWGAVFLLILCWLSWSTRRQNAFWPIWTIVATIPFITRPPQFFYLGAFDPMGVSRYLYFASAGSSLLLAGILSEAWKHASSYPFRQLFRLLLIFSVVLLSALSWHSFNIANDSSWFSSGRHSYFRGRYSEASIQLRRSLPGHPFVAPPEHIYYYLLDIELMEGKIPDGLISEALNRDSESRLLQLIGSAINSLSQDPEIQQRGQRLLHTILLGAPASQHIFMRNQALRVFQLVGEGFYQQGLTERAVHAINQAFLLDPEDPAFHALYGEILISGQDFARGEYHYQQAIEFDDDAQNQSQYFRRISYIAFVQGDLERSVAMLDKAFELDPGNQQILAARDKIKAMSQSKTLE